MGYTAITEARSAISAVVKTDSNRSAGPHPSVVRFVKRILKLRTPVAMYKETLDVNILLNYFKREKPNAELALIELTRKVCALLIFTAAQRLRTIHLLKLDNFQKQSCVIAVHEKLNHARREYSQGAVKLENLCHCCARETETRVSKLVSWCFKPSQPQRITSGLNTNFTLSPS